MLSQVEHGVGVEIECVDHRLDFVKGHMADNLSPHIREHLLIIFRNCSALGLSNGFVKIIE